MRGILRLIIYFPKRRVPVFMHLGSFGILVVVPQLFLGPSWCNELYFLMDVLFLGLPVLEPWLWFVVLFNTLCMYKRVAPLYRNFRAIPHRNSFWNRGLKWRAADTPPPHPGDSPPALILRHKCLKNLGIAYLITENTREKHEVFQQTQWEKDPSLPFLVSFMSTKFCQIRFTLGKNRCLHYENVTDFHVIQGCQWVLNIYTL